MAPPETNSSLLAKDIFVSIVVPTRNRVDWLKRCLEGIAEQTFTDYEVIVVDDGSSRDVLDAYEKMLELFGSRFSLFPANRNEARSLGPSVIRNMGIAAAKGEYIAFCDDDDYWCDSDYLLVAVASIQETAADLHFSNQKILRGDEVVAESSFRNVEATLSSNQLLSNGLVYQITREQILNFPDYAHLNITIAKTSLLEDIGGFWEETRYAEDVDIFVRLCSAANKILFRPDVCSIHNSPARHDRESASKNVVEIDRRLLENLVYWHLLASCKSPEAIRYASNSLSSNAKLLTQDIKSLKAAAGVARIASAIRPTFKWTLYSIWLSIRAIFGR